MNAKTSGRSGKIFGGGVLALVLAAAGFWTWQHVSGDRRPVVAVEELRPAPVSLVLALNGHVKARRQVAVMSPVAAHVARVEVAEGDSVTKGQQVLALDTRLIEARREQALAALKVQEARLAQAEADAKRAEGLASRAISRADLENAELALATAKGESLRLQSALEEVEQDLARYRLVAPLDGVVLQRDVEEGQLVSTQDSLFVIADPKDILIEAEVDELYAQRIAAGQKAMMRPIGGSAVMSGIVGFAAARLDSSSGGRRIEIELDTAADLPIGLTVETNVMVAEVEDALSLPRSALIRDDRGWQVLVVKDGRAVPQTVSIIDWPAERVVVAQGLSAGAQVILAPDTVVAETAVRVE